MHQRSPVNVNPGTVHVPLKILSIETGEVLKSFNHTLHRKKKVDFIEQFNEKLLLKQEDFSRKKDEKPKVEQSIEEDDSISELPEIPALKHLAKARPKRPKKHAASRDRKSVV